MANPSRVRKRVHALRRAADGSAFENCERCGMSVAIALADMHECKPCKKEVKIFKGPCESKDSTWVVERSFANQPRSAFCFFMETFRETNREESFLDIDRKGLETWKNMSNEERQPYLVQALKVNAAHFASLLEEVKDMGKSKFEDGAESSMLGESDTPMHYLDSFLMKMEIDDSKSSTFSWGSRAYEWSV
ncbi:hypothetical protein SAY86_025449 [Trapa natans]|uniref:HMG box domain-containing protein n=1 Tax=Trapa natans TaxID=22666 RepID=A0AAN7M8B4_TRANT|nr:hypothetical protein SAY86_025449 [Trapa natans]